MDAPADAPDSLADALDRARALSVSTLADAIESIGFDCTHCGACCRADPGCGDESDDSVGDPHTATVFPDEVRKLQDAAGEAADWRDVARPMPYGLRTDSDGTQSGETFEWALQTDACGDCAFYADDDDGTGGCTVHPDRPLICQTYPFSVALSGTSQPLGEAVDEEGLVRAHECEGLGRSIERADAEELARTLKERAIRELEEAIAVTDAYEPVPEGDSAIVVHDSEGPKRPDGTPLDR